MASCAPRAVFAACVLMILSNSVADTRAIAAEDGNTGSGKEQQALRLESEELAKKSYDLLQGSRYLESLEVNKKRLEINRRLYAAEKYPNGHEEIVMTLLDLARAARTTLKYEQSAEYGELALQMARRLFPESEYPSGHETVARCLAQLGNLAGRQGNIEKAKRCHEEAIRILERRWSEKESSEVHQLLAVELSSLASDLAKNGEYKNASSCFQKVATLWDRFFRKQELSKADLTDLRLYLGFLNRSWRFPVLHGRDGRSNCSARKGGDCGPSDRSEVGVPRGE